MMTYIYFCVFESVEGARPAYSFIDSETFIKENIQDKASFTLRVEDKPYSKEEVAHFMDQYSKANRVNN
jgi:hypothetical protein